MIELAAAFQILSLIFEKATTTEALEISRKSIFRDQRSVPEQYQG